MDEFENIDMSDIKVILLGESGIGKTSLINVSMGIGFNEAINSSSSSTFVTKMIKKGEKEYTLNIWDTAGQEKFRSLTNLFIKNSKIVIFVYAINSKLSFDSLPYWVSTVKEILGDEPILAIVGNKSDLYMSEQVKQKDAINYANKIGAKYRLVSAKTKGNAFSNFLEELLDVYIENNGFGFKENNIEIKNVKVVQKKPKKSKFC